MENIIAVAVKGIIISDKKILIIQRSSDDDFGANDWEFAGGKLEFNEDLVSALKREAKEEVGLDINVEKLAYARTFKTNPNRQVVILTYLCSCHNNKVILSNEHQNYKWVNKSQIENLLEKPILQDLIDNNIFDLINID